MFFLYTTFVMEIAKTANGDTESGFVQDCRLQVHIPHLKAQQSIIAALGSQLLIK